MALWYIHNEFMYADVLTKALCDIALEGSLIVDKTLCIWITSLPGNNLIGADSSDRPRR